LIDIVTRDRREPYATRDGSVCHGLRHQFQTA
jgi:hypothetical protein